jgi:hypothetical protein
MTTNTNHVWANLPTTCPDFVSHPHKVETKFIWTDKEGNKREETKMSGCYTCQMALASEEQGTTALMSALMDADIACEVVQTGGFCMCVYIKLEDDSFIYANTEGFGIYANGEDYEPENFYFGDNFNEQTATQKAQKIVETLKEKNLLAVEI